MSNNKQSSIDAYCNSCDAFICDALVTFEDSCSNCGTQIEYFENEMSNNKQTMKLYTEEDLIYLVQLLKDYTRESHTILGHDEREAKQFVDIYLKDRTPIELPSNEEILKWWQTQKFQKEQGEQEYTMIYEIDLPKILKAFIEHLIK